jgi:hypothetical protein
MELFAYMQRSSRSSKGRVPMSDWGDDQIVRKAKELCRRDCKAWSLDDFENGVAGVTMLTVVADQTQRTHYLSRAKAMLEQESKSVNGPEKEASRGITSSSASSARR